MERGIEHATTEPTDYLCRRCGGRILVYRYTAGRYITTDDGVDIPAKEWRCEKCQPVGRKKK